MSHQDPVSYFTRALAICEQELGAQHPDTARSLNNLATLYRVQGKYEQAEPLLQQALAVFEHRLGADHPHTRRIRGNYEGLLRQMQP